MHTVAVLSDDRKIAGKRTCADPCVIIKNEDGSRVAYAPDSVIGSVFEDAINGYLEQAPAQNSEGTGELAGAKASSAKLIPAAFHGEWDKNIASCGAVSSVFRLRVSRTTLDFYESVADVRSLKILNPRAVAITATSAGEGQVWDSEMELVLSRSGNELTVRSSGDRFTRIKCP